MSNFRTYKRKLILTDAQQNRIEHWMGVCRMVYNMALEIRLSHYKATGKKLHKYELMKQCTSIRADYDWVRDVSADSLNKMIDRMDNAYELFFRTCKNGGGLPKFSSKRTFRTIPFKNILEVGDNYIEMPKLGKLKIFKDSSIHGTPKTATITKEPTGYFICIQCENVPKRFDSENQTIGLDMGIANFCIDSNGKTIQNPRHLTKYERKLRVESRALSRKKRGSNSWKKQAKKLSLLYHKVANVRRDFLHKESTKIVKCNSVVFIEDLNIKGMAKSSLSKHLLDAGWGMFREMLSYKTTVIKIDPKYTSQTCNECGAKDKKSRISQAEFVCTSCGHVSNADVNAAKNILGKGIALTRQREAVACA